MNFESLVRKTMPGVAPELAKLAISEIVKESLLEVLADLDTTVADGGKIRFSEDEPEDSEEVAMLRGEIGRLNSLLNAHMEGISGASAAGMDVLGERARQRRMEGYDDEHDDAHDDFSLSSAAIAYVMDARLRGTTGHGFTESPPADWPWDINDWKPKAIRQALVAAAAMVIAEIERIDRIERARITE